MAVHNGTTVGGLAAEGAAELSADGFTVTGTATAASRDHAATVVQCGPGPAAQARTGAEVFPGAESEQIGTARINVVLGRSCAGTGSAAAPTAPAVPAEVADGARSADEDPCADLTYG